ncbi:MAG: DoxX family protein [Candidatus Competibacteraceae bacterium]
MLLAEHSGMKSTGRSIVPDKWIAGITAVYHWLDKAAPLSDLLIRLWVANAFFQSGLTKIASFDTTIQLFTYEYMVPFLPPTVAAVLGTFVELVFPVLLALGLATRPAAAVLFIFNIIAVISYPELMGAGLRDHQLWGMLLLAPLLRGPGALSLDHWLSKWFRR